LPLDFKDFPGGKTWDRCASLITFIFAEQIGTYTVDISMINIVNIINTSSTAQGGGGSFKNRKPIGEVGCCESRMAERSH
jgi:hypothetical protein